MNRGLLLAFALPSLVMKATKHPLKKLFCSSSSAEHFPTDLYELVDYFDVPTLVGAFIGPFTFTY